MTRVLIADDNAQNLYLLETVLKSSGYEVTSARDGVETLELAHSNPPDIIVTDILMPKMDGFELCRRWKSDERLKDIPFIFYTATYTDLKDEEFARNLGADRFVVKPQQPEVMVQIVKEVLDNHLKESHVPVKKLKEDDVKVLQQYNDVLFRKLERKVRQLEGEIEKQKKTQNELFESERKYHTLVRQSPDGIFSVNLDGFFLSANKAMCETLKYTEEELLSMKIWDIVPQKYANQHKKRLADIAAGRSPSTAAEYSVRGKDGQLHFVEILSAPYYEDEKLIGFQAIARDISERKQMAAHLEYDHAILTGIIESPLSPIFSVDLNYCYTSFNSSHSKLMKELHGVDIEIGKCLLDYQSKTESELSKIDIDRALRGETIVTETSTEKESHHLYLEVTHNPITNSEGKITGVAMFATDITIRKRAEEKLKQSYEKLQRTLGTTVEAIATMAEIRDPYTAGHQKRVTELACKIAETMGLSLEIVGDIRIGGTLHDVGKMCIPAEILSKPGKLNELEFYLIRSHPQIGYDIVNKIEFSPSVSSMVLQHHERINGSGYPKGLRGDDIILEAKILAVADVVEAMASHRPYRPSLGIDKALEEIAANKGILYDNTVADTCIQLFRQKGFNFQ